MDGNKEAAAAQYINADPPEPVSDGSREQHQLTFSRSGCGWRAGCRPARWEWHRIRKAMPADHDYLAASCGQPVRPVWSERIAHFSMPPNNNSISEAFDWRS